MTDREGKWRYAVVGNIVKTHIDEEGILRYGSGAFTGGTRVYLCGKLCRPDNPCILVIGKNRHGRYVAPFLEKDLIENVRWTRAYKPIVLHMMDRDYEFAEYWWTNSDEDLIDSRRFYKEWLRGAYKYPDGCSEEEEKFIGQEETPEEEGGLWSLLKSWTALLGR